MKNLLTLWNTKKENQKILSIFSKKPFNLIRYYKEKPKKIWQKKSL